MIVQKAIVIEIKPYVKQKKLIQNHIDHNRFIYNHFLQRRKDNWEKKKIKSSYRDDALYLTQLKKINPWLFDSGIASQQYALKNLDDAFKRFFRKQNKFPKFKKKAHSGSFKTAGDIKIKGSRLYISNFREGLKFNRKLPEDLKILNATVSKRATGKYYVSLLTEQEVYKLPKTFRSVGIDLGLTTLAILSDGTVFENPRHTKKYSKKLKQAQRFLARKKKHSKRKEKQRLKVARICAKTANSRKDYLNKVTKIIVSRYDFIGVETLKVKNMMKNRKLSKSIQDVGWAEFIRQLDYKCSWYGKELIKIDTFYASSKICHHCNFKNVNLALKDRVWTCRSCGEVLQRDLNAAINILKEARRISGRQAPITDIEDLSVFINKAKSAEMSSH